MLSESAKQRLRRSYDHTTKKFGVEGAMFLDPGELVAAIADYEGVIGTPEAMAAQQSVKENRREAELYLAGLMGMM